MVGGEHLTHLLPEDDEDGDHDEDEDGGNDDDHEYLPTAQM